MRHLIARLRAAFGLADVLAAAGIALLAVGAWMAWPPAGFLLAGSALILIARTEAS